MISRYWGYAYGTFEGFKTSLAVQVPEILPVPHWTDGLDPIEKVILFAFLGGMGQYAAKWCWDNLPDYCRRLSHKFKKLRK